MLGILSIDELGGTFETPQNGACHAEQEDKRKEHMPR
jgi:hypothetical protein